MGTKNWSYFASKSGRVDVTIRKGRIKGTAAVPSSKSLVQRYMIGALLSDGITDLIDVQHCNDTIACLSAIHSLMPDQPSGPGLQIRGCNGRLSPQTDTIHCGESGFALRALTSVAALSSKTLILNGTGSLLRRPMNFFADLFPQLEVECETNEGFLPVKVKGPIQFRNISVDGSLSSQFLSGLLMVYPLAKDDHLIEVKNLSSKNYIDLTIQVMKDFGVTVRHDSYRKFFIPGNQHYKSCKAHMEGDWSAASFMLVAGATAGAVTVENMNPGSFQPDRAIVGVLNDCGVEVSVNNNSVSVISPGFKLKTSNPKLQTRNLKPFNFDATGCPDLFPPLVALAVMCNGISEISGVERLIHKESNRALALHREFSKLNKELISVEGNKMIIRGRLPLKGAIVDSHNDHRIAMALAVTGLNVEGGITINDCEVVDKSYPDFFLHLKKLVSSKI